MKIALLLSAALIAPILGSSVPKIALTESMRYETKTRSGGGFGSSWSETQSASRTKLTINAELPLSGVTIDENTAFRVKAGAFEFVGALKDDPAFRPGATSARLVRTQPSAAKGVRTVLAKVDLKWQADRMTVKVVADNPNSEGIAATAYKDSQVGPFEAMTKASISFGSQTAEFDIPIRGKVSRKTVDTGDVSGGATTVDLKGEVKATS